MSGAPDNVLVALNRRLGLSPGPDTMEVTPVMMDGVAVAALGDHCHATSPRTPTAAYDWAILYAGR